MRSPERCSDPSDSFSAWYGKDGLCLCRGGHPAGSVRQQLTALLVTASLAAPALQTRYGLSLARRSLAERQQLSSVRSSHPTKSSVSDQLFFTGSSAGLT